MNLTFKSSDFGAGEDEAPADATDGRFSPGRRFADLPLAAGTVDAGSPVGRGGTEGEQ
jgi:hypothetical protein